ncbi:probable GPI-anchored adhesin-like protein PGA18 [Nicotiana tomentosiformis]|uniref:probable GPI-anchored adhesin-like protein PGA18 n=1 Tax=Nicotiana tomentosiformis TaxID=4098 RepID=UPI00388C5477
MPLSVQKVLGKRTTLTRPTPDSSDTSEYLPSLETSEGDSVQPQPGAQSEQFPDRLRLVNEPTSSSSSSDGSEGGSQASKPSSTPATTPATTATPINLDDDDEVSDDGRWGDTIVGGLARSRKSEVWADRFGADNPKFKGKATTSAGQSEEPGVVATGSVAEPSTAVSTSTGAAAMPPPSSGPSLSVPLSVPTYSTYPQTSLRVSQTLSSLNNWMQAATTKLTAISSAVATQSSAPSELQIPPSVEDSLKNILDNQKKILDDQKKIRETVDTYGSIIKDLGKQVKKMRKTQASKESVEKLSKEVEKIASAGDIPLDCS